MVEIDCLQRLSPVEIHSFSGINGLIIDKINLELFCSYSDDEIIKFFRNDGMVIYFYLAVELPKNVVKSRQGYILYHEKVYETFEHKLKIENGRLFVCEDAEVEFDVEIRKFMNEYIKYNCIFIFRDKVLNLEDKRTVTTQARVERLEILLTKQGRYIVSVKNEPIIVRLRRRSQQIYMSLDQKNFEELFNINLLSLGNYSESDIIKAILAIEEKFHICSTASSIRTAISFIDYVYPIVNDYLDIISKTRNSRKEIHYPSLYLQLFERAKSTRTVFQISFKIWQKNKEVHSSYNNFEEIIQYLTIIAIASRFSSRLKFFIKTRIDLLEDPKQRIQSFDDAIILDLQKRMIKRAGLTRKLIVTGTVADWNNLGYSKEELLALEEFFTDIHAVSDRIVSKNKELFKRYKGNYKRKYYDAAIERIKYRVEIIDPPYQENIESLVKYIVNILISLKIQNPASVPGIRSKRFFEFYQFKYSTIAGKLQAWGVTYNDILRLAFAQIDPNYIISESLYMLPHTKDEFVLGLINYLKEKHISLNGKLNWKIFFSIFPPICAVNLKSVGNFKQTSSYALKQILRKYDVDLEELYQLIQSS